jgi:hypothetical protein
VEAMTDEAHRHQDFKEEAVLVKNVWGVLEEQDLRKGDILLAVNEYEVTSV